METNQMTKTAPEILDSILKGGAIPDGATSFFASEGTWRMLRNLSRDNPKEGTIEAAASELAALCCFSNE